MTVFLSAGHCTIPCKHDGVCVGPNKCSCKTGYTGDLCQKGIHLHLCHITCHAHCFHVYIGLFGYAS